jgi:predicted enzyme related to lactoylglutathione lyase
MRRKEAEMPRVTHFDINADDPERAAQFYSNVFGWKFDKWQGPAEYWLVTTGPDDEPGINGGLMKRTDPSAGTWNTVEVRSVDDAVSRAVQAGGSVVLPKQAIPGGGYQAYCRDTEGNVFGLHESDESAQ